MTFVTARRLFVCCHMCYVYVEGSLNTFCDTQSCRKEKDEPERRPKSSCFMKHRQKTIRLKHTSLNCGFCSPHSNYSGSLSAYCHTSSVVSRENAALGRSLNEEARTNQLFPANGVKHSRCFQMGCVRNNIPRSLVHNDLWQKTGVWEGEVKQSRTGITWEAGVTAALSNTSLSAANRQP